MQLRHALTDTRAIEDWHAGATRLEASSGRGGRGPSTRVYKQARNSPKAPDFTPFTVSCPPRASRRCFARTNPTLQDFQRSEQERAAQCPNESRRCTASSRTDRRRRSSSRRIAVPFPGNKDSLGSESLAHLRHFKLPPSTRRLRQSRLLHPSARHTTPPSWNTFFRMLY